MWISGCGEDAIATGARARRFLQYFCQFDKQIRRQLYSHETMILNIFLLLARGISACDDVFPEV